MNASFDQTAFDLSMLLAPLQVADFVGDFWEKKPFHHQRQDALYFQSVLTVRALEDYIASSNLRHAALELAKDGAYLEAESFTHTVKKASAVFAGVVDLERVRAEHALGATIVLPALQRTWQPLKQLCAALEDVSDHPVHANGYLTPGNSIGFTPHYDTHGVFVLQIAGRKQWKVYTPRCCCRTGASHSIRPAVGCLAIQISGSCAVV